MKKLMLVTVLGIAATGCSFSKGVDASPECEIYCDTMLENCPNTFADDGKFDRDSCVINCEDYRRRDFTNADGDVIPLGDPVPNSDTLECRVYHANNASAQPDGVHCTHASPEGGGTCVQFKPPCERYCAGVAASEEEQDAFGGVVEACLGQEGAFADIDACADFCNGLATGTPGDLDGNTANCRISWAEQLATDPEDKATICENALAESSVCVTR